MNRYLVLTLVLFLSIPSLVLAADRKVDAPDALENWYGWIVHKHPELSCSPGFTDSSRQCQWRSPLKIVVSGKNISFYQKVTLEKADWLVLPGEEKAWPKEVRVNRSLGKVMRRSDVPALFLEPGEYELQGKIETTEAPLSLRLPPSFTFVDLVIDGKVITNPAIDNQSLLLNQANVKAPKTSDALDIQVFRLISDGNPLWLDTIIKLNVSGDRRIQTLGRVLPEGFELSEIKSNLPLRVNKDGNMEIQLDAGNYSIVLKARQVDNSKAFKIEPKDGWPEQELWSFKPNRSFRIVDLDGTPIDGSQTNMPQEWKDYTTYLLKPDQTLGITEKSRGDNKPDDHKLMLSRTLWLNFDGSKFTSEEKINGTLGHLDRLSAQEGYSSGRVSVNNEDVLITTVNGDQGIEVLPGRTNIISVGELPGHVFSINPWSTSLESASLTINLPPGYRLFTVKGADDVSNAYVSSWNLWSIFIVILFIVFLAKQYGVIAAVLGLLYALAIHDVSGAPSIILLLVVVGIHFVIQSIPENKYKQILNRVYQLVFLLVVLSFLPFAVDQARLSLYPQLERPYQIMRDVYPRSEPEVYPNKMAKKELHDELDRLEEAKLVAARESTSKLKRDSSFMSSVDTSSAYSPARYKNRYQEGVAVQTGPGMPAWTWNSVSIRWDGPVALGQTVQLMIMPPWLNRMLNILRIVLFIALFYVFLVRQDIFKIDLKAFGKHSMLLVIALCMLSVNAEKVYASDFPSNELLEEYYQRLNEAPACAPDCAAYNYVDISANAKQISLDMKVATLAKVPVALPINLKTTRSAAIKLDGKSASELADYNGVAYLLLDKGNHDLEIKINVSDMQQVFLNFINAPQLARFHGRDWDAIGIDKQSVPTGRIHLKKIKNKEDTKAGKRLTPDPIKPLVKVSRELNLDLDWVVVTRVSRVAPVVGAISISIPLLPGESVTTADVKVKDNQAQLDFSASTYQLSWTSVLEKKSPIELSALASDAYYETWTLNPSLKWHVAYDGLHPIKSENSISNLVWWPLADDKLNVSIDRPAPLEGSSSTIDSVKLLFEPGRRQASTTLELVFRSSRGNDYPIVVPEGAEVTNIVMNNKNIIFEEEGGSIALPVPPGESSFKVEWKEVGDFQYVSTTPEIKLPNASNVSIETSIPRNRWVLWVSGPLIGPAILFWGVLLVILAIGFALGRQSWSPLKSWEWMLMGTGIATSFWPITILVVAWFALFAFRNKFINQDTSVSQFKTVQVLLGGLTVAMLISLVISVSTSLMFGSPDMQIVGNGSNASQLRWYQDLIESTLPVTHVFSVPMWIYQLLMLLWSIWLSTSLVRWLKWGWQKFNEGGIWKDVQSADVAPQDDSSSE